MSHATRMQIATGERLYPCTVSRAAAAIGHLTAARLHLELFLSARSNGIGDTHPDDLLLLLIDGELSKWEAEYDRESKAAKDLQEAA